MTRSSVLPAGSAPPQPRIVVAYSGSPATADAVQRLAATYAGEVVTLTLDLGQGKELEAVRDRALTLGAVRAHVLDAHDLFVREYLLRALRAGALADGERSLVRRLTGPLVAQKLVEIAAIEQAASVAHVSSSAGDGVAVAVRSLAPQLTVIAVPHDETASTPPSRIPAAPAEPAFVELTFERGAPTALNGIAMPLLDALGSLTIIAGSHGLNAARVLNDAHADLQRAAGAAAGEDVRRRYIAIIESGRWFEPERQELDALIAKIQDKVHGSVRLKLHDGSCDIIECKPVKSVRRLAVAAPEAAPARSSSRTI